MRFRHLVYGLKIKTLELYGRDSRTGCNPVAPAKSAPAVFARCRSLFVYGITPLILTTADRDRTGISGIVIADMTNRKSYGYAVSLEEAKTGFRAEYEA